MLIQEIKLRNFLSFGDNTEAIKLGSLNVLIGPNGSGKSNFLQAFDLLKHTPHQVSMPIRKGGGTTEWINKQSKGLNSIASVEATIESADQNAPPLQYLLAFREENSQFRIDDEQIHLLANASEKAHAISKDSEIETVPFYQFNNGHPRISVRQKDAKEIDQPLIDISRSVLAQRRDPLHYPAITYLAEVFTKIRLYRELGVGRNAPYRIPQQADALNDYLEPDGSNLGMMLNRFRGEPEVKKQIQNYLKDLYSEIDDFGDKIVGGTIQVYLEEDGISIPSIRLSDGTLRYLCLLAVLCHPEPPPLICIEEPELGLHPDILPGLAKLLIEASERTQLIITTHSDMLVGALSDYPETVLVCEKYEDGTRLERLKYDDLKIWLEKYGLGELWIDGHLGGKRW